MASSIFISCPRSITNYTAETLILFSMKGVESADILPPPFALLWSYANLVGIWRLVMWSSVMCVCFNQVDGQMKRLNQPSTRTLREERESKHHDPRKQCLHFPLQYIVQTWWSVSKVLAEIDYRHGRPLFLSMFIVSLCALHYYCGSYRLSDGALPAKPHLIIFVLSFDIVYSRRIIREKLWIQCTTAFSVVKCRIE